MPRATKFSKRKRLESTVRSACQSCFTYVIPKKPVAKEAGRLNEIPTNHNPRFAPVIHPTLQTGVEALVVAARAWLAP